MTKNEPPNIACESCGKQSTQICDRCYANYQEGWLCDECSEKHKCGEEALLPVVNSPRVGQCGYTGD